MIRTVKKPAMKRPGRLEMIARRQRNGRKLDLFFACFVALVVTIGASAVGSHVFGASTYVAHQ